MIIQDINADLLNDDFFFPQDFFLHASAYLDTSPPVFSSVSLTARKKFLQVPALPSIFSSSFFFFFVSSRLVRASGLAHTHYGLPTQWSSMVMTQLPTLVGVLK